MGCCFYSNSLTDPRGAGTVCHLTSGETEAPLHWACGTVASQLPTAWLLSPRGPWEPAAFHNRALTAGGSHRPAGPSESGPRWPALPHPPQGGLFSEARPRRIPHSQEGWHRPPPGHTPRSGPQFPHLFNDTAAPRSLQGLSTPQRRASPARSAGKGSPASLTFRAVDQSSSLVSFSPRGIMGTVTPSLEPEAASADRGWTLLRPAAVESTPCCSRDRWDTSPRPKHVLAHPHTPAVLSGSLPHARTRAHPRAGPRPCTRAPPGRVRAAAELLQLLLQQLQAGVDVAQLQGHRLPDPGVAGGSGEARLR